MLAVETIHLTLGFVGAGAALWIGIGGLGLAAAGAYLSSKKKSSSIQPDDAPTTLSQRGSFAKCTFGRFRIGVIFTYTTDLQIIEESVGGKGFGSGSTVYKYKESGVHVLSVTLPMVGLYKISNRSEEIWSGELTPDITPDGSLIDIGDKGSFRVFWGSNPEDKMLIPNDDIVIGMLDAESILPGIARIVWQPKNNGNNRAWGDITYEAEFGCPENALEQSAYWVTVNKNDYARGINPAHLLYQLFTAQPPNGAGIAPELIDATSLEAFGVLCEEEGFGICMSINGGDTVQSLVQKILDETSTMLIEHDGVLIIKPLRDEQTVPSLTRDWLTNRAIERDPPDPIRSRTRLVVNFFDRKHDHATNTTAIGVDAGSGSAIDLSTTIETVTDRFLARQVGERRRGDLQNPQSDIKCQVFGEATNILPGQVLEVETAGRCRVKSVLPAAGLNKANLTMSFDVTGRIDDIVTLDEQPEITGLKSVAHDLHVAAIALDGTRFVVARIRAHEQITGAVIYLSTDGGDGYRAVGVQDAPAAGGELLTGIDSADASPITDGPYFIAANSDDPSLNDLRTDTTAHQSGVMLCLINDEIMYPQWVQVIGHAVTTRALALAPLIYYGLDELAGTAVSNLGSGGNGVISGGVTLAQSGLLVGESGGYGYGFDGIDAQIQTQVTSLDSTTDWTCFAVVNLQEQAPDHTIWHREDGSGTASCLAMVIGTTNGAGTDDWKLASQVGGVRFTSSLTLTAQTAHAIAVVYDATAQTLTFALDGVTDVVDVSGATPASADGQMVVGINPNSSADAALGVIDTPALFAGVIDVAALTQARSDPRVGYQLHGLIRAQQSTTQQTHAAGDVCFVLESRRLSPQTDPALASGVSIDVKTRPANASQSADISGATPVNLTMP